MRRLISMRWWLSPRTLAALVLLIISVSASVSTGLLYSNARDALHRSEEAQAAGRATRRLTELHFCHAINVSRAINNRDRRTFLRSRRETRHAIETTKDPVLHGLLVASLKQNAEELHARPFLKSLKCVSLIRNPPGSLPPPLQTTPTLTG